MRKTILVLVGILVGLRVAAWAIRGSNGLSGSPEKKLATLKKVAADLNRDLHLPTTRNGATMQSVEGQPDGLVMHMRMDVQTFTSRRDAIARGTRDIACTNEAFVAILKGGLAVKIAVEDPNGGALETFAYRKANCPG